jgi:hypothetical protein
MRADPVGQRLREGRLGIGIAGGAEHTDESIGISYNTVHFSILTAFSVFQTIT